VSCTGRGVGTGCWHGTTRMVDRVESCRVVPSRIVLSHVRALWCRVAHLAIYS
jgi:hypothetical protein